ncbi:receptor kinase-like protein Xa21 [Phoenix dactylifera]|uniref:Receptor kinase-like protein Xa21 n=1 Tax=Phoenix dactylifera TaxID=42345 RepID=A0A8B7MSR8_PHODC|nr:receptor kinase-like protein Xa21 [Phoenix dactylifera]
MEFPSSLSRSLIPFLLASILVVCVPTLTHQSSLVGISGSNSTSTREVLALLSFKSLLSDPNNSLSSWNNPTLHFCNWHGVICGGRRHPDRVTALELDMMNLRGPLSPSLANLTFLKKLHLAGNHLNGSIPPELGRLSRLKHLDLSYNDFEGEIPASLSNCSSLQNISLSYNMLSGWLPPGLSRCSDLRIISLELNLLTGEIPDKIVSLPKLSWLNLGSNSFSGGIPAGIGGSSSLTSVMLLNNSLTGTIPPCLGNISTLTYLLLSRNNLHGPIPPSLGNCSNLIFLSLGSNSLEGEIPESLFHKTSLEYFDVSSNNLSGMVPFSLYNLSSIQSLSLGLNQFIGTLPPNLGRTLPGLRYLCVAGSQLEGPIPPSLSNASHLQILDFNGNKFSGRVPSNLGQLQNLSRVNLGYNLLEARDANDWKFLNSLTNCTNIEFLDLSHNFLAGTFPSSVCNLTTKLERLLLSELPMSGSIPEELENLEGLQKLDLSYNILTGNIPGTIGKLRNLGQLTLSGNRLSGPIPASLGNLTHLELLNLRGNYLQGNIPKSFINYMYLDELDLSYNQLSGTIPHEVFRIPSLTKSLDLSHNSLVGSLPPDVGKLKLITQLDVSENKLSGKIPSALGDCVTLNYLSMEGNFFEGIIPLHLSSLKSIQRLDLSCNKLSGQIPEFFTDIRTLYYLNLSFNDLEGPVPEEGIFTNTSEVFLEGNEKLCGGDPKLQLPLCSNKRRSLKILFIIVAAAPTLIIFLLGILCWKKCPRKRSPSESSSKDQNRMVSYTDLRKATGGFSSVNLIGVGSFGSVYKGILDAYDKVVAVKVLNLQQSGALKSYLAECEALRNIRHRNLIKIITTCSSVDHFGNDFKALVFDFVSNGSLEEWLHPRVADNCESRHLSLAERLDIAIDVASALEYLHHHHGKTPIVHCDVKPSNILLDDQKCAHLGDFGLARFLQGNNTLSTQDPTNSIALKGSIGYIAPEYGMGAKVSTHGDVYSYGILLLELLTGKRPTDDMFKDGQSLRNFVEMGYPERVMEIVDPSILLSMEADSPSETIAREGIVECLVSMIDVGLLCSKEAPNGRMEMQEVATEMDAIRTLFVGLRSNTSVRVFGS